MSVATETRLDAAIEAATTRLLELQHPDGYWVGELESNVTMTAQHLFWHHVLGLRTPELDRKIANELLARQRDDGTWAIWFDGPGDLSTTVEAYAALKLAGVDPGPQARDFIRSRGGIAKTRIFTKCFLALLGQWPWQRVTPIPVELVLFPPSAPFSIYNFSCWARGTFVPLAACRALRPVRHAEIDLREIGARPGKTRSPAPPGPMRRAALREAERWVRAHQEADGSWGGIQPPWVWSILMLAALGHGFEDETLRRAVEGWEGFTIDEGDRLRPEACQSPVWDTGLAVLALRDAGLGPEHPALVARGRLAPAARRSRSPATGPSARRSSRRAAGPSSSRTTSTRTWTTPPSSRSRCDAATAATTPSTAASPGRPGMQSRSGGWGAFDVDNEAYWLYKLPFCDFGKVTDEPSADVSAHALEALAPEAGFDDEVRRGLDWLLREQEADGSWFGRWGVNHVYGTGAALPALEACGIEPGHRAFRRAVAWLDSVQNEDGGFGEDIRSYADRAWRGRGASTPSQTAWALLAYVAADEADSDAARRAAEWLCSTQLANGDWDEAQFTGTGFPLDFMIRYHLYRLHFPLLALGRLRERLAR